jgi:hypothetical protein
MILCWGHTGVLCVSYRDLWRGPTEIFGGVLRRSLAGSYRDLWRVLQDNLRMMCLFSLNESVRMDCSEIYKNTNRKYPV